ncbi:hypothetical protein [Methylobrevis pamukkalensis]|uniref:Uncharacterized protein n=1 Tax=Methylobrevis pamukkalensis TaxID=1439726 RepID=A0A1E3H567_9HYPH|nr:hypothetical protein [Methylobrevis pamukkalensis]ODN70641.1 hypothetical protein A6302_02063 [Methylobrevis pamukkalensis]
MDKAHDRAQAEEAHPLHPDVGPRPVAHAGDGLGPLPQDRLAQRGDAMVCKVIEIARTLVMSALAKLVEPAPADAVHRGLDPAP